MEYALVVSSVLLWIVVLLNLLLTLALVRKVNAPTAARREEGLKAGQQAPDFAAQTLQGETVTLATYAGRLVAFIFIAAHCGPCREDLPELEALGPSAARAGVDMVLVSVDGAEETQALVDEFKISLPVLVAPRKTNDFALNYKSPGTPSYCLVNGQGIVQSSGITNEIGGEWKRLAAAWEQKEVKAMSRK